MWTLADLNTFAEKSIVAYMPVALMVRIVREATETFDAADGSIALHVDPVIQINSPSGVIRFESIKLFWGNPTVAIRVDQIDDRFRIQLGAPSGSALLGYQYEFGRTEEMPAALFTALFSCALESMRLQKALR